VGRADIFFCDHFRVISEWATQGSPVSK